MSIKDGRASVIAMSRAMDVRNKICANLNGQASDPKVREYIDSSVPAMHKIYTAQILAERTATKA